MKISSGKKIKWNIGAVRRVKWKEEEGKGREEEEIGEFSDIQPNDIAVWLLEQIEKNWKCDFSKW